jgi:hypothetical protein
MHAGQAVTQFATDIRTEREFAIKFFATREAFLDETALYTDSQVPLTHVREICDNFDGRFTDATGKALPPCIVMEKGEALSIYSRRNKGGLDRMTALQVLMCSCFDLYEQPVSVVSLSCFSCHWRWV